MNYIYIYIVNNVFKPFKFSNSNSFIMEGFMIFIYIPLCKSKLHFLGFFIHLSGDVFSSHFTQLIVQLVYQMYCRC